MNKQFQKLVKLLTERNLTIASCESFTGGMFANELTNIAGTSKVFIGSFISYSNEFKQNIVKVNKRVIKKYGVVSQECAEDMVYATNKLVGSDLTISFTGNAGPTTLEDKPAGLAYVSILFLGRLLSFKIEKPELTRIEFKINAINVAMKEILKLLEK